MHAAFLTLAMQQLIVAAAEPIPQSRVEDFDMIEQNRIAATRAAQAYARGEFRRRSPAFQHADITPDDKARWAAEREAKLARKAAKRLAIRDAQLARGQRVA